MIAFLLKLTILVSLIGWIFSRRLRKAMWSGLQNLRPGRKPVPADRDTLAFIRDFLAGPNATPEANAVSDFYVTRSELGELNARSSLKESLHVWVFASLAIPWVIYYFGAIWYFSWQAPAIIGVAILGAICAMPLVATAMLPFAYDSPRDFSIKDFLLLILCGAVAASWISSIAEAPGQHDADLRRFLLVWPVYQVALSLFGVLHWIKNRLF